MINKGLLSTIALSQSSLCLSHTKDHCEDLREGEDILFLTLFIVRLYHDYLDIWREPKNKKEKRSSSVAEIIFFCRKKFSNATI